MDHESKLNKLINGYLLRCTANVRSVNTSPARYKRPRRDTYVACRFQVNPTGASNPMAIAILYLMTDFDPLWRPYYRLGLFRGRS